MSERAWPTTDRAETATSAPRAAPTSTPGTTLSNTYEIVEYLALGGMAEVYRARNIHTDEPVAIKVVLPEFARDETRLALFRKEATVLSRLHHEAIVHYHMFTVEKETNRPYLVMEFVKGTPLSDRLKQGPLDATSVKALIRRVASGLSAAHELGVVHRDLSPDNVVLPDGNVGKAKIIDFGIAKDAGGGTLLGGKFAGKVQLRLARAARPFRRRHHRPIRHLQPRPHRRCGAPRRSARHGRHPCRGHRQAPRGARPQRRSTRASGR